MLPILLMSACVKDDFVDDLIEQELRITVAAETIALGDEFQFDHSFFNNIGQEESVEVVWTSSDAEVLSITPAGLAQANGVGQSTVTVEASLEDGPVTTSIVVTVGSETVESFTSKVGEIETTSFYTLEGSFELSVEGNGLFLDIADNYEASSSLPGLYLYLSNNRNSIGNAKEISEVRVFEGAHSYTIENTDLTAYSYLLYYCKPFNVKVGEASLK